MGKCSLLGLARQWRPDLSAAQEAEASLGSVDPISEGKKGGYRSVVERSPDIQKPYHSVPNTMWRNSGQSQSLADTGFYSRIAVLEVRFVQSVAVPGVVAHTFSHGTQGRKIPWSSRPARAIKTLVSKKPCNYNCFFVWSALFTSETAHLSLSFLFDMVLFLLCSLG